MAEYHDQLARAGILLDGSGLQPSARGWRIRYSAGQRTVIDGPFSATGELGAGYTIIQVRSREEALEWTRRMVVSDDIHVMLLVENFFQTFTKKPVADATKTTEVLLCLSCDSRAHVDELVVKALAAGGKAPNPIQDHGFMYTHGFEDIDGHMWELMYMEAE